MSPSIDWIERSGRQRLKNERIKVALYLDPDNMQWFRDQAFQHRWSLSDEINAILRQARGVSDAPGAPDSDRTQEHGGDPQ
jgi:uncharacterized protein (DUF4415 family)